MPKTNNQDTKKLGGKGSGLIWLSQNTDLGFSVPMFEIIDTSYHEDFLRQPAMAQIAALLHNKANPGDNHVGVYEPKCPERLEEKCDYLAKRFMLRGKSVAVRSSAVLSEDSERLSGAGIYGTFFLEKEEVSPKSLAEAVLKVYTSVNSPRAVQYRKDNGIEDERMAVVVQELSNEYGFYNGVMQSRLHAVPRIIPVSWSSEIGAVVEGKKSVKTVHFKKARKDDDLSYRLAFVSDNSGHSDAEEVNKAMIPLIIELKERYGRDFEAEFSANFEKGIVNLLQIRPLTNIVDKKINFPKKKPIFTTGRKGCCVGAGEYIGPWVHKDNVNMFWDEPEHYAFIIPSLPQMVPKSALMKAYVELRDGEPQFDYEALTPNKKAIIVTRRLHHGSHALTLANEKGIICIGKYQEEKDFTKPMDKISPYIHVVCDGLIGRVYEATEQEAREFEEKYLKFMKK